MLDTGVWLRLLRNGVLCETIILLNTLYVNDELYSKRLVRTGDELYNLQHFNLLSHRDASDVVELLYNLQI